jgi:hypothetical protein
MFTRDTILVTSVVMLNLIVLTFIAYQTGRVAQIAAGVAELVVRFCGK